MTDEKHWNVDVSVDTKGFPQCVCGRKTQTRGRKFIRSTAWRAMATTETAMTSSAKVLNVTIPPLSSKEVQALSNDDLKKGIIEGKGKMKSVKGLSADVTNVIAFIRSLAKK
jgi:hypothetical protein